MPRNAFIALLVPLMLVMVSYAATGTPRRPDPVLDLDGSADVPTWHTDDFWNYTTEFTYGLDLGLFTVNIPFSGWLNMSVDMLFTESTGDRDPVYILGIDGNISGGLNVPFYGEVLIYLDIDGYFWQRMQDLALYRMVANVTVEGTESYLNGYYPFGYEYYPPLEEYDFPLIPGENWTTSVKASLPFSPESPGIDLALRSECLNVSSRTVPAGTFDVWPVTTSEGGTLMYNETVGNAVFRSLYIEADSISMDIPIELGLYRHRPSAVLRVWVDSEQPVWAGEDLTLKGYYGGIMATISIFVPGSTLAATTTVLGGPREFSVNLKAPWKADDTPTLIDHSSLGVLALAVGTSTGYAVCTLTTKATDLNINDTMVSSHSTGYGTLDHPFIIDITVGNPSNFAAGTFDIMLMVEDPTGNTSGTTHGPYSLPAGEVMTVEAPYKPDMPGNHSFTVVLDPFNDIREIDEDNNTARGLFFVDERAPLVWNLSPDEGDLYLNEGEALHFAVNVTRYGESMEGVWTLDGDNVGSGQDHTFSANHTGPLSHRDVPYIIAFNLDEDSYFEGEKGGAYWEIHVIDVDRPPVIDGSIPPDMNVSINEGEQETFSVTVSDPDGDDVELVWSVNGEFRASGSSLTFFSHFTGENSSEGSPYHISLLATSRELNASVSWTLHVIDVDRPFEALFEPEEENITLRDNTSIPLRFSAYDPDGDPIRSNWTYLGSYHEDVDNITLNVTGMGLIHNQTFDVSLNLSSGSFVTARTWRVTYQSPLPVPEPPEPEAEPPKGVIVISPAEGAVFLKGDPITLRVVDSDDREVNYTWTMDGVTYYGMEVLVPALEVGNHTVLLNASVSDPATAWVLIERGFSVRDTETIDVRPPEDEPSSGWFIILFLLMALAVLAALIIFVVVRRKRGGDVWSEE
ncbi:MAG: CARDB domain-containing protein [Candidatus Thermoplasmatota archaeon]|nr:CARDB domain-containing protein [Candidatus Thermoplasmatota archaeon]